MHIILFIMLISNICIENFFAFASFRFLSMNIIMSIFPLSEKIIVIMSDFQKNIWNVKMNKSFPFLHFVLLQRSTHVPLKGKIFRKHESLFTIINTLVCSLHSLCLSTLMFQWMLEVGKNKIKYHPSTVRVRRLFILRTTEQISWISSETSSQIKLSVKNNYFFFTLFVQTLNHVMSGVLFYTEIKIDASRCIVSCERYT